MLKTTFSKQNRALLGELVRTDFKLRYQGSLLGYAWSLLKPLMMFLILYVVFVRIIPIGKGVPHYPAYLLLGIVLWNFFNEMTVQSLNSVVARGELIRKIKIPRWTIVVASSLIALINLALNLLIIAIFMIINHVTVNFADLYFPIIVLQLYIFSLGVSLFLAAFYVKFRDVSYIWDVVLQGLFYLSAIIYPLSIITNPDYQKILLLNPITNAIQDARYVLISPQTLTLHTLMPGHWIQAVPYLIMLLSIIIGAAYFRSQSKFFAENV